VNVIDVEGLSKDYRQHFWTPLRRVLHNVTFVVREAEIFGFLGPNGSGKSTTIKILLEIIFPTEGRAKLFGKDVGDSDAKRHIGFLPENPYFYDYLTSTQFLEFHGSLQGMSRDQIHSRIPKILEQVGMRGTEHMRLRNFSKGMLQRIGLAQAILHDPKLVILDEPMTGLDPVGRKEVRDLMLQLREQGKTVFFSTHILSDVEMVCDRVAILNKGHLLSCGKVDELIAADIRYVDLVWGGHSPKLLDYLRTLDTKLSVSAESIYLKVFPHAKESGKDFERRMNEIVQKGIELGGAIQTISPKKETLEDVFVKQVGHMESRV